ncbi:adenylyltransferase/cytidyltransferase family protein [Halobacillus massiliensis]|uniref:adenylyltransferase/cytidyltransferase family protein n=1 Tax=Halobacillus massiliensis TaxID=1926286 RepID=UPI0009E4B94A|nr:adenylyltransferase/cytidyltransferase family protein [Halobacillus massiliensis]
MRTIRLSVEDRLPDDALPPASAAVGFFDGVHKGHQKVIETAQIKAEELGTASAVITFDPHPSVILNKKVKHARYITPLEEKEEILKNMGVDLLYIIRFDKSLASLSPKQFVEQFFVRLNIRHVAAGFDFSFGYKGEGSMKMLPELSEGRFSTTTVSRIEKEELKVSSTRIRALLDQGDMEGVQNLLGRPFAVCGELTGKEASEQLSVKLMRPFYMPKPGLYAVIIKAGNESWEALARISNGSDVQILIQDSHTFIQSGKASIEFYGSVTNDL